MTEAILEASHLQFAYRSPEPGVPPTPILHGVSLRIERGDFVAIQGPSGSGKSTLFYLLGCLLSPDSGSIRFQGREVTALSRDERAYLRNEKIGFVFQQFHLLAKASVLDNILLSSRYPCERPDPKFEEYRAKAIELAKLVGLDGLLDRLPNQLSGGQQQRVAIARALLKDTELLLADEPTGNLDSKNAEAIMELLEKLNRQGKTVVIITHDGEIAKRCKRTILVRDGLIAEGGWAPPKNVAAPVPERKSLGASFSQRFDEWVRTARAVLPLAWENIWRNRMKSVLTMAGVTVGITAVLSMVTVARFVERQIMGSFEDLGSNNITLNAWRNYRSKGRSSKKGTVFSQFSIESDIKPLMKIFPDIVNYTPLLFSWGNAGITYNGRTVTQDVRVIGVDTAYLSMNRREVLLGKPMSPFQVERRTPVCLIGWEIARQLFQGSNNPIGEVVFVSLGNNAPPFTCRVTAVLASQTSNQDWMKPDYQILLPWTYLQSMLDVYNSGINRVALETRRGADVEGLVKAIKNFFTNKYGGSAEIYVGSDAIMQAQLKKFLGMFSILISSVALITLAVGGMGINNMMLVSVNERLKEIGLRKALGATDRSVRIQLLAESVLLCSIAGLIGIIAGIVAYQSIIYIAAKFVSRLKFEWVVEPWAMSFSAVAILAVGIFSGLTPALKAEKLQVLEALRSE